MTGRRPEWAPAHAGLARTLAEDDPPAAAAAATRALEIDPHSADAELLLAHLDLDNTRWDAARERIDARARVQSVTARCAARWRRRLRMCVEPAKRLMPRQAGARDQPAFGEIYRVAAELAARNYRFDEAVGAYARSGDARSCERAAHAELGMHLMRTGDEAGRAKRSNARSRPTRTTSVTYNLLGAARHARQVRRDPRGRHHPQARSGRAPVMREYAMPLAQEALKTSRRSTSSRRRGRSSSRFPGHDDFAVRTLGLPG